MAKKVKPSKDSSEVKVESLEKSYKGFFQECLSKGLVKPWQEQEIYVFFRELGLRDKEPSDKYIDALKKF